MPYQYSWKSPRLSHQPAAASTRFSGQGKSSSTTSMSPVFKGLRGLCVALLCCSLSLPIAEPVASSGSEAAAVITGGPEAVADTAGRARAPIATFWANSFLCAIVICSPSQTFRMTVLKTSTPIGTAMAASRISTLPSCEMRALRGRQTNP